MPKILNLNVKEVDAAIADARRSVRQGRESFPIRFGVYRCLVAVVNKEETSLAFRAQKGDDKLSVLGTYGVDITLEQAHIKADELRGQLKQGIASSVLIRNVAIADTTTAFWEMKTPEVKALIEALRDPATRPDIEETYGPTFADVARLYWLEGACSWARKYAFNNFNRIKKDAVPTIGKMHVAKIETMDVLRVIKQIEKRGCQESPGRMLDTLRNIITKGFTRYQKLTSGRANPAAGLEGELRKRDAPVPYKALNKHDVRPFVAAVEDYHGTPQVRIALLVSMLLALRTNEVIGGRWDEINWDDATWLIPAERMKGRTGWKMPHLVPLSRQAFALLKELHKFTGGEVGGGFMFPAARRPKTVSREDWSRGVRAPLSHGGMSGALRILERADKKENGKASTRFRITVHGFRALFSTICNDYAEAENEAAVEQQLAHALKGQVRKAYFRLRDLPPGESRAFERRRALLQWYADYIDKECGKNVVRLKRPTAVKPLERKRRAA